MGFEPAPTASETGQRALARPSGSGLDLEFFERCFGDFPDPVIVTDMHSRVVFLNDSAQCLTGRSVTGGGAFPSSEILRTETQDTWGSLIAQCLETRTLDCVQAHLRDGSGCWLPYSLSAQLAAGREGKTAGCVAIARQALSGLAVAEDHVLAPIFASVIDNFPMPFFTVDTTLTVTYMNQHLEKLTGYNSTEVIGRMTCAELFQTDQCHTADCVLKQAMENRTGLTGLRRVVRDRSGRKIPVAVHSSVLTDSAHRVIGGFKALRDITPLAEAEQKIRMLVEITQEGILMVDENDRVIYANAKMTEILEHSKDELIGKDVGELLPSQHVNIMHDLVRRVDPEHPEQLRFCSTIQPASASQQDYRAFETCIIVSRAGANIMTCMYFHDLTKHIEIERQLYDAYSFLNNIIKSSADGIVVVDASGNILIFNESAERILGFKAEEVIGKPVAQSKVYSPDLAREIMRRMRSSEDGPPGKLISTRITLVSKDGGQVPVNFSAAIIEKNDREIGSVGIFSDLRERLKIRKELEEARTQLMQAEKIASIGRLASGVAHEINNPLSGILIYADLLLKDLAHNPGWSEDLQEIITQTLRCKQIVGRLLDFSRQSQGHRVFCDINTIIRHSTELLAHQALFHDIDILTELDPGLPQVTADPGQLQQVFTNLLLNAGAAMQGKGRIRVASSFDPVSEQVTLLFEDSGPGIPPDNMDKIFEPFFTTKAPGEGTGLGLSVVHGIIQQHGGSIEVANSPSGGAVFAVTLPLQCPDVLIEFTS
jgi:two-component system, NtrC family, sensor kinase